MKKIAAIVFIALFFTSCSNNTDKNTQEGQTDKTVQEKPSGKPVNINEATFREKIFDYTKGGDLNFLGNKPCIVDFYADWCMPCRRLGPILDELAKAYNGKVDFYKVNTDENQNLSRYFNIASIPAVMLCPTDGKPQMMVGLYPKDEYVNAINQVLIKPGNQVGAEAAQNKN